MSMWLCGVLLGCGWWIEVVGRFVVMLLGIVV